MERSPQMGRGQRLVTWIAQYRFEMLAVVALWVVAAVVFKALGDGHVIPRRPMDEFLYWHGARNFAEGDGIAWRELDLKLKSNLYMWLISLSFLGGRSVAAAYSMVHTINAVAMSAVVVPAYVLARQFMGARGAFFVALLAIATPSMNYVGLIGTETLAYPVFTASALAMVLAIDRPTRLRWVLALASIALAFLTRSQFAALLGVFPLAILLAAMFRPRSERREYLRSQREPLIFIAGLLVVGLAVLLLDPRAALGQYQGFLESQSPSVSELLAWVRDFAADALLLGAIVPALALIALLFSSETRRDRQLAPLLAVALSVTVVLTLESAWFSASSQFDFRKLHSFYERYQFYISPLLFTSLIVYLRRGTPAAMVLAAAIAAPVLFWFDTSLPQWPYAYDSWSLTPIGEWVVDVPDRVERVGLLLAIICLALGIAAAAAVSRTTWRTPTRAFTVAAVLGLLVWSQASGWQLATADSKTSYEAYAARAKPLDFVDQLTKQDVGIIVTKDNRPLDWFQTEFWNRHITHIFKAPDIPILYSPNCDFDWYKDGVIKGTGCPSLPGAFYIHNDLLSFSFAGSGRVYQPYPNIRIAEVGPRPRLLALLSGRDAFDGTVRGDLILQVFGGVPARLTVKFSRSGPPAQLFADGRLVASSRNTVTVPVPSDGGPVTFKAVSLDPNDPIPVIADLLLVQPGHKPRSIK